MTINNLIKQAKKLLFHQKMQTNQLSKDPKQSQIMKKSLSTLKYMELYAGEEVKERTDSKSLVEALMSMTEPTMKSVKEMKIPEHLTCPITNYLFTDPVMLTSGQTYEASAIKQHMANMKKQADAEKLEIDESEYDFYSYFLCPITRQRVDPELFIENTRIKEAAEKFLQENDWAFEFYAGETYQNIVVRKPNLD